MNPSAATVVSDLTAAPGSAIGAALLAAALALAPAASVHAAEPAATIAGVTFDMRPVVGGEALVLNGTGVRAVAVFKGYAAALYMTRRADTYAGVGTVTGPKRLQMRLLIDVPMAEFVKALRKGIERNQPESVQQQVAARQKTFEGVLGSVEKVKSGDTVNLDFTPDAGLQLSINGKAIGQPVPGADFYQAMLGAFIGAKVSDDRLRDGLLGRPG